MKLHAFKYILSASMALSSLTVHAIYPDSVLQQKMLIEEQTFLAKMKPGLQYMQMRAVRAAMQWFGLAKNKREQKSSTDTARGCQSVLPIAKHLFVLAEESFHAQTPHTALSARWRMVFWKYQQLRPLLCRCCLGSRLRCCRTQLSPCTCSPFPSPTRRLSASHFFS